MKQSGNLPTLDDFEPYRPSAERVRSSVRRYEPDEALTIGQRRFSWTVRIIAAVIMLETIPFKFMGHPESVYIFSTMNMESWWRYGQGIWELLAAILLFLPRWAWLGGLLTLGAMGAAIVSHLTILGIEIQGDHGLLFGMACTAFVCSFLATWLHQQSIPNIVRLDD